MVQKHPSIDEANRGEPPEDVLEQSGFHKALLLFHIPAVWTAGKVALAMVAIVATVGVVWGLASGSALGAAAAAIMVGGFILADALLLRALPRRGISYGPWQPQLFVLALPRSAAAALISLIAVLAGVGWGLAVLFAVQLLGSIALHYGTLIEPFRLQLTHLTVESDRLASGTRPIRILHISDLHIERLTRREERLLALAAEARPDLILITGDYLNLSYTHDPEAHAEVRRLLSRLSAPYGVYASLGSPPVDVRDIVPRLFDDLPVKLLVDDWAAVDLGDGREIVILGLECSHHLPTDAGRLDRLVAASPNSLPNILLYHAPDLLAEVAGHGIDLYLCGHTHGGQVRLPWLGAILTSSQLGKQYEMGHYQRGRTHMYVSRGVGLEGLSAPRVRFLAPPEITLITLEPPATTTPPHT